MILGLLAAAAVPTSIGTVTGTAQAIRAQENKKRELELTRESHLFAYCEAEGLSGQSEVHGRQVVLRNEKVYLATRPQSSPAQSSPAHASAQPSPPSEGHPFSGFFVSFPTGDEDNKPMGLVSMISKSPPAMGWIYRDKTTRALKYGNRTTSLPHLVGPWDMTEDLVGLLLRGEECFVAVEEERGVWAVYAESEAEAREGEKLPRGKRSLEISLERKVKEGA